MIKDRQAFQEWEQFRLNIIKSTQVEYETETEKQKRIIALKKDYEAFFKYYFPHYCYSESAPFHKRASKRFIETDTIYEVRAWSRELAKSARTMMETLYLVLTKKVKNILLISATSDSAENLLNPFKLELESNQRIINDFGEQKSINKWESLHFVTRLGVSFLGFGAGQSPRGTRNEAVRPDVLIFDDIDTDEEVRSKDRIAKKWDWIEQAVMPTVSVSKAKRIIFLGNIIGKDTCITRAIKQADFAEIINIRDKNGVSTWANKNTEESIDWLLSKMSHRSAQKEYFNNPISEGTVFKQVNWGKIPDIRNFQFIVKYGDPSYSNQKTKKNSSKAVVAIGEKDGIYYIFNCRLDKATNAEFVKWFWQLDDELPERPQTYNYIENNTLQDPFFSQVLKPEFEEQSIITSKVIYPFGDDRKKPEKFFRCEGNLEPLNRDGKIIFDEKQKDNPHMKRLAEDFMDFSEDNVGDGVDAVEGGIWIIGNKLKKLKTIISKSLKSRKNKRY
jgi:hypothetical protein